MSRSILELAPPPAAPRIRYGPAPLHVADLRVPEGPGPHPCVIAIHGGFWRNRYDLDHLGHLCAALTGTGFATWNIEYRRVGDPGGGWPGTFHDVVRAARHLFAIDPCHRIDPGRVIVLGHSAGGHLASWLASIGAVPPSSGIGGEPLPLRGTVALAGVLDLRRAFELDLSDGAVRDFLGGAPGEVPERYAAASPIALCPLSVPHLLIHGGEDEIVPLEMSERLHAASPDATRLLTLPGAGHVDLIDPRAAIWPDLLAAILAITRGRFADPTQDQRDERALPQ